MRASEEVLLGATPTISQSSVMAVRFGVECWAGGVLRGMGRVVPNLYSFVVRTGRVWQCMMSAVTATGCLLSGMAVHSGTGCVLGVCAFEVVAIGWGAFGLGDFGLRAFVLGAFGLKTCGLGTCGSGTCCLGTCVLGTCVLGTCGLEVFDRGVVLI